MKKSMLIAWREWRERIGSRSFILFSLLGPLVVLGIVYLLFVFGGDSKQHWNVLVADPTGVMANRILIEEEANVHYSFADGYIEMEEFRDAKKYQRFDAMIEINEKVLSNKVSHLFFRKKPSVRMQTRVQFHVERRLEEVMVGQFTNFSLQDYRKIKQPLNIAFHDVYDPYDEASDLRAWAGLFYGTIIFVFIFLFGMTILRSVSREKSNRIVEVLLASVSPNQLMLGKIIGIGFSALLQFLVWTIIIGFGLYFMRETLFPNILDPSNMNLQDMALQGSSNGYVDQMMVNYEYNAFVELVYTRIKLSVMLPFFLAFFIAGYFFYGALFAAVGATMGSESDGQQFVLPIIFLLCFAMYSGYHVMNYPESGMSSVLQYLPFTSPVVAMVKLSQGYAPGEGYQIYLSLILLCVSAFLMLVIAARLYRNGILQYGHRVRFKHIFKWLKRT